MDTRLRPEEGCVVDGGLTVPTELTGLSGVSERTSIGVGDGG